MPKLKTHKGIKKRVKVTAGGKLKREKAFGGHLMSGKSGKRCRHLRKKAFITGPKAKVYKYLLGGNF
ncbi:MAG TPA: 50S ribosomal protein L35 [Candidatus Brocadiia bacterium]|nr:50S ribosomal protein L35 [Planctomycetota bacterium]MBI4008240.1 50S ribosomal protein L35 [Planctomycetota bacterium]MDO8094196.1 50S ribosomal protein L35 [Candidatus Brocadiales bacterium]